MSWSDRGPLVGLLLGLVLVACAAAAWRAPVPAMRSDPAMPAPALDTDKPALAGDVPQGLTLHCTTDGSEPGPGSMRWDGAPLGPDEALAQRRIRVSTSPQWRAPAPGDQAGGVAVRARYCTDDGRCGPVVQRTWPIMRYGLPVLSLVLPDGAFLDPDTGIYVVGHAIFRDGETAVQRYPRDQKWWKYPGNYQFRGEAWERSAGLEVFEADGARVWAGTTEVRINGNNTRGFPQHALRLSFDAPMPVRLFGPGEGSGHRRLVLRAGGNDQDRAFLRDALQHRLCTGMPFMTSAYRPCVLLVNGTYWGLHDLRERMDDREVARRIGAARKDITILADRAILYDGDERQVARFTRLLARAEKWDAALPAFVDSLEHHLDLDGFLQYMAAQIILGNADWPDQNVKYWRYTGRPDTVPGPRDGRWRFIMGDSDQGFGHPAPVDADHFAHVLGKTTPVPRLFKACLRSEAVRERFRGIVLAQLDGPLASDRMEAMVDRLAAAIAPEMPRQVRRWRRPASVAAWEREVEALRRFARERGAHVRRQLNDHFPSRSAA